MAEVLFDPISHTYRNAFTGEEYISVTRYIKEEEGEFDEAGAINYLKENVEEYKNLEEEEIKDKWEKIRIKGKGLHKAIESWIKNGDLASVPLEHKRAVERFAEGKWGGKLHSEVLLYSHTLKMAGTCDIIVEKIDHEKKIARYIFYDIKTSRSIKPYKLERYSKQIWLYKTLFEEMKEIEEKKDLALFEEQGLGLETYKKEFAAGGIIHYEDYIEQPEKKPSYIKAMDMSNWVDNVKRSFLEIN